MNNTLLHSSILLGTIGVSLVGFGCAVDSSSDAGETAGDGDGDAGTTGDGDGDPTGSEDPSTGDGDGDGDPSTGDGDGDPTTGDGDGDPTTGDGDGDSDILDMDGVYLFALETSLGPDLPLQFVTTVSNMTINGASATADFSFQPLSLGVGETTTPREFVGDPLVYTGVTFDAVGDFTVDMGTVMVSGLANPVTGSDIEATLQVIGGIVHANAFCGELAGDVTEPLEYDLAGSTFAAIRLDDDGSDPATLPLEFPYRCDMVPPR